MRLQKVTSIKPNTADPWKASKGQQKKEQTESNKDGKDGQKDISQKTKGIDWPTKL